MAPPERIHAQIRRLRHDQIVDEANRLLASKGYELMTIDELAAQAGISKMGLYRYFASKELVAAAAMRRLQRLALDEVARLAAQSPALDALARLQGIVAWALRLQFQGEMPSLPSQNSALVAVLTADAEYMALLDQVAETLGAWIREAQREGSIDPSLPVELVVFTLFARACDPVAAVLKAAGHDLPTITAWILRTCFQGLAAAPVAPPAAKPKRASAASATSAAPAPTVAGLAPAIGTPRKRRTR